MYKALMKQITFIGKALDVIKAFPADAKREAGHQMDRLQNGFEPTDWKPMKAVGSGVYEIRINQDGQFRVIYISRHSEAIYILHAFQKKTQKTSKNDKETIKKALKELQKIKS